MLSLRLLRRDWRSGELAVLGAALVVAVAAITAVGAFTDRVGVAVGRQAAQILAADLTVSAGRPVPERYLRLADQAGVASARKTEFPSMAITDAGAALAEIRAVTDGYPLRGVLKIRAAVGTPERTVRAIPPPGEVWAGPNLLARLDADVGDLLTVGDRSFIVGAVLSFAPDQGFRFSDLAPTLLMNDADLASTGLLGPGSRVSYTLLFAGDAAPLQSLRRVLETSVDDAERIRDIRNVTPELERAVRRAEQFLGLSALVSVLLAAVAVGMAARRYAARHLDTAALMKCMGASQAQVLGISVVQLVLIAVVGGVVGAALGFAAQAFIAWLLADLAGGQLPPPTGRPLLAGLFTAVVLLTGFALPPVMALSKVPPLRVLRHDVGSASPRQVVTYLAAVAAIAAMLFWFVRDTLLVAQVLAGTGVALLVLALCGALLVLLASRVRGAAGVAWRFGLANIGRRGVDSVVQVVAFGLGLMVLLLLTLVRNDLLAQWRASLGDDAPNWFLINIQPDEREIVERFFAAQAIADPTLMPLVRGRMTHINGVPVGEIDFPTGRGARFAQREANLTFAETLRGDNRLVAGRWWASNPVPGEVSVETEFAERLGLSLGDVVTHDIAGESVDATITSLRSVDWETFQPNFFLVFSPGTLDDYAHTWVGSLYLPPERADVVLDLVRHLPSVTAIDIDAILGQVRGVMDKAALAVQYVFVFTLLAGVTVLFAAQQATRDERAFESALLRALGASRRVVFLGVATEFTVLGVLSGILAAGTATLAGALLAAQVFELEYVPDPWLWVAGLVAGALIVGGSGLAATRASVDHPPMATLR